MSHVLLSPAVSQVSSRPSGAAGGARVPVALFLATQWLRRHQAARNNPLNTHAKTRKNVEKKGMVWTYGHQILKWHPKKLDDGPFSMADLEVASHFWTTSGHKMHPLASCPQRMFRGASVASMEIAGLCFDVQKRSLAMPAMLRKPYDHIFVVPNICIPRCKTIKPIIGTFSKPYIYIYTCCPF